MDCFKIEKSDNVAVALRQLEKGEHIHLKDISLEITETIPAAHKIALQPIQAGEAIVKYGNAMGLAICDIPPGSWVLSATVL